MLTNAFIGRPEQPTDQALADALGPTKPVWDQVLADVAKDCGANNLEWKSYSPKAGWALRVKRKERTIIWLSASTGAFTAAFILGEKAMVAVRQGKWSQRFLKILDAAPKYPEGTGVRIEVKTSKDLPVIKKLAAIKLAN